MKDNILLFTTGLLSSAHCIGMCGCFVTAYSMNLKGNKFQKLISHLLYSFGRITTYTILGGLMGFLGSNLFFLSKMAGVQNYISVTLGILMIYLGVSLLGLVPEIKIISLSEQLFVNNISKFYSKLIKKTGIFFTFPIGLLLGFLPCCLLYTMELKAMQTGNIIDGVLTMLFFGLGTIPSLLFLGITVNYFTSKKREIMMKLASLIIIFMGLDSIYRALFS